MACESQDQTGHAIFSYGRQTMVELSRIPPGDCARALSMTGGWRRRARALPCVHRASSIEHRASSENWAPKDWLHQRVVAFPYAWECFEGRSFSTASDEKRSKHWRRLLWRPGRMNRPHIVYQALWAMRPSRRRRWSGAQESVILSRPRLRGERLVPEELAHGLSPSALGRHFE